jgi:hypothetical protein
MTKPKYPDIHIEISDENADNDADPVLDRVSAALKEAGVKKDEINAFVADATAGDYEHLLSVVMQWVDVS